jgi:hypothetical protein
MMQITEIIKKHLGWCPNAQARVLRVAASEPDEVTGTPSGSGSFQARALGWLGLFRNQVLLLATWFSIVGYLLLVTIGNANGTMFFWGLLAGLLLSAYQGVRFWRSLNEVRESGAVFLTTLYDKLTVFIMVLVLCIPPIISVSTSPAANLVMWNAVTAGFIFILFWVQLLVVWLWETRTHRHLQSDGLMLSLGPGKNDSAYR